MKTVYLREPFCEELALVIKRFDCESSEETRSHRFIARLLNELEEISKLDYSYAVDANIYELKVTNFIILHKRRKFFVLVSQPALKEAISKNQIFDLLTKDGLKHGCISDGIMWEMVVGENGGFRKEITFLIDQPQKIVGYITGKMEGCV